MNYIRIADLNIAIDFVDSTINSIELIPSTEPFRIEKPEGDILFKLTVDDTVKSIAKDETERIGIFDTGNGKITVDRLNNGGYQYLIKDINEQPCCLLITDKQFHNCKCALNGNMINRKFGLNNALMLIFAFAGSYKDTLLIHASLVRNQGYGYAFIAKSGTGKSTHTSLWMKYIEGCDLMNDDNPIIRFINGKPWIYGSPWSGKTPCYRNVKAPLGAITRIDRAKSNSIELLNPIEAFASLLPSCSHMKWDHNIHNKICDTITRIIETTKIYTLHCLPNEEAAKICHKTILKK